MGSSSLNALVKAFDRLQLVLGWNSSCTGEMLWGFELAFDKSLVMSSHPCQASTCFRMGSKFRCIAIKTDRDAVD
jgi:hypothetical protein